MALRTNRSGLWAISGILVVCAVVLSVALQGHFREPAPADVPPVATASAAQPESDAPVWTAVPSVPVDGWLPASRSDTRPFFNVRKASVDVAEILDLPPGAGEIEALDSPRFIPADEARWLAPGDEVIGVSVGRRSSRCYPLAILKWHNVVNDVLDGRPVAIVFDPVSGAATGLSRQLGETVLRFGISGKACRGSGLLHDVDWRRLWSPMTGRCLTGEASVSGAQLERVVVKRTTWACWRQRHYRTEVLSRNTGLGRPYSREPYAAIRTEGRKGNYWSDPQMLLVPLPANVTDQKIAPKTLILGARLGDKGIAFIPPAKDPQKPISQTLTLGGRRIKFVYDPRGASWDFSVSASGQAPDQLTCYWFAWQATWPDTAIVRLDQM